MKNYEQISAQGPLITKGVLQNALANLYRSLPKGNNRDAVQGFINGLYTLQNETNDREAVEAAKTKLSGLNKFLHSLIRVPAENEKNKDKIPTFADQCLDLIRNGKSGFSSDLKKLNDYLDLGLTEDILVPPKNIRHGRRPSDPNSVKLAANGISLEQYTDMVNIHYDLHRDLNPRPSNGEIESEYNKLNDRDLKKKYDSYLHQNRRAWEAQYIKGMPRWILNTGNTDELNSYLAQNQEHLSYEQQFLLRDRIRVTELYKDIASRTQEQMQNGEVPTETQPPEINGTAVELKNAHQTSFQTSGNGCWSCFMQIAASSRGVNVTQEDLRAYRPDLNKAEAEQVSSATYLSYNTDITSNFLDRSDALLNLLPNTKVNEFQITGYNQSAKNQGISKEQYLQGAFNHIKKTVHHALEVEHSPVGVLRNGHYITIVGIDGDKIKYKNSIDSSGSKNPDETHEATVQELFSQSLLSTKENQNTLQFSYLSDIKLSKDGKTLFGVPSSYIEMYEDGTVSRQPEAIASANSSGMESDLSRDGFLVDRKFGKEYTYAEQEQAADLTVDNVFIMEKTYLPKKLNAEYLRRQADARSLEEENRLRQADNQFLGLEHPAMTQEELDRIKAEQKPPMSAEELEAYKQQQQAKFEQDANLREADAKDLQLSAASRDRLKHLKKGFDEIAAGKYPELFTLSFLNEKNMKLNEIPKEDLDNCNRYLNRIIGEDIEQKEIIGLESGVLDSFYYNKEIETEAGRKTVKVNLREDVAQRLAEANNGAKVGDSVINQYVRAEIVRLMTQPESGLSYQNGQFRIDHISAAKPPQKEIGEKLEALSNPQTKLEKYSAQKLRDSELPTVENAQFFDKLIQMAPPKLKELATLYNSIFGTGDQIDPGKFTVNVELPQEKKQPPQAEAANQENKPEAGAAPEKKPEMTEVGLQDYTVYMSGRTPAEKFNDDAWTPYEDPEGKLRDAPKKMVPTEETNKNFLKAGIMTALVNGYQVKYEGKELPDITPLVNAQAKQSKQLRSEMSSPDITFSPAEQKKLVQPGFTVSEIQQEVKEMLQAVKSVDHSKWIKSSPQFKAMKQQLTQLNKLVNEQWADKIAHGEPITFEMMSDFLAQSEAAKNKVAGYLNHKEKQMRKDPSRRTDPGKKEYEQPRIQASLGILDKLQKLNSRVEKGALNAVCGNAKEFFTNDMKNCEAYLNDSFIRPGDYKLYASRVLDRSRQASDDFFVRQNTGSGSKETLTAARERIMNALDQKYTNLYLNSLNKDRVFSESLQQIENDFRDRKPRPDAGQVSALFREKTRENQSRQLVQDPDTAEYNHFYRNLVAYTPEQLQQSTQYNATELADNMLPGVQRLDVLFGPSGNSVQMAGRQDYSAPAKCIGEGSQNLSAKDFAAIAFAGSLVNCAEKNGNIEEQVTQFGAVDNPEAQALANSTQVINAGREKAKNVLDAYHSTENPDKTALAELLAEGIKMTVSQQKNAPNSKTAAADAEMAQRMYHILGRDPELMQHAKAHGLKDKHINYIKSLTEIGRVEAKCIHAYEEMKNNPSLTAQQRKEYLTDIIVQRMIQETGETACQSRNKDKNYSRTVAQEGAAAAQRKYPPSNQLVEKMSSPGVADELRKKVYAMVEKSSLSRTRGNNLDKSLNDIAASGGFSNLMKKYKDAPVKGGEYQVEAVLKDWKRKQKKAMDQKKHEAAKAPANQNEKKERTSSLGKSK